MAKPRNSILDLLTYLAVRVFAMIAHMFPVEANYATARVLGDLLFRFDRRHRERAMQHLRLSFPDWTERRYRRVARDSMRNITYLGVEFLFTTRLLTPSTWRRHVRFGDLSEALRLQLERRTGVILLTAHFGNWEIAGYTMAALGFPSVSVARRLDNPHLDRYVFQVREAAGQRIVDKKGAMKDVPEVLDAHGSVGFVADQDAGRKGAFVDFFGRKASTYKSIGLMAMRYGAPIIVGYGKRLEERFEFEIGVQRIIHPSEWAHRDDPLLWITQEYTRAVEDLVRSAPAQYLWVHRRWKHRPKGEAETSDGVA